MEYEEEVKQNLGQKRYWTRVISLRSRHMPQNMKFDISED
jgi:hypothetical protein